MTARKKTPLDRAWPWVIRFLGAAILVWETVVASADRPQLLVIAVGLIFGPSVYLYERGRPPR